MRLQYLAVIRLRHVAASVSPAVAAQPLALVRWGLRTPGACAGLACFWRYRWRLAEG